MLDIKTALMIAPLVALLLAVAYGPLTSHADPAPRAHLEVVDLGGDAQSAARHLRALVDRQAER